MGHTPVFRSYAWVAIAQLPWGVLALWLGLRCDLHFVGVSVAPVATLVLGNQTYYEPSDPIEEACVAGEPNVTGVLFIAHWRVLGLESSYFLACGTAAAFAVLFLRTGDEGADESIKRVGECLFWAFVAAHGAAAAAATTQALASPEAFVLRAGTRVTALGCMWTMPRGAPLPVLAAVVWLWEVWVSLEAACSQAKVAGCIALRALDILLLVGHRWELEQPRGDTWRVRVFFAVAASLMLQSALLVPG